MDDWDEAKVENRRGRDVGLYRRKKLSVFKRVGLDQALDVMDSVSASARVSPAGLHSTRR